MTQGLSVEDYIARQDDYAFRRKVMHWMLRNIGFTLLCKTQIIGLENIPATGPTILMMNHISAIDPAICMGAVRNRYVIPMTKIENTDNLFIRFLVWSWGAYTVNRGEVDRKALLNSIELLKSGQMILIAPEGTRHPEGLAEGKDGLAYIAIKANGVILPTALAGSQHFKKQWKRLRPAQATVSFGRPFRFKTNGRSRIPREELAFMTQEAMYQLALAQPDSALRGLYSDLSQATTDTLEFV